MLPWDEIEADYAAQFSDNKMGASALSAHVAAGALIIKEMQHVSDEESVEQIREIDRAYIGGILRIINLSPEIQQGILDGTEPDGLSINKLKCAIPADWNEQKKAFASR